MKFVEVFGFEYFEVDGGCYIVKNVSYVMCEDILEFFVCEFEVIVIEKLGKFDFLDECVVWLFECLYEWKEEGKKVFLFVEDVRCVKKFYEMFMYNVYMELFMFYEDMCIKECDIEFLRFCLFLSFVLIFLGVGSEGCNF